MDAIDMRGLLAERVPASTLDTWPDGLLLHMRNEGLDRRHVLYNLDAEQTLPLILPPSVKTALVEHWGILGTRTCSCVAGAWLVGALAHKHD